MIPVLFHKPLSLASKEDLERKVFYISEAIRDFRMIIQDGRIAGLEVELGENAAPLQAVTEKIHAAIENQRKNAASPPAERVWSIAEGRDYQDDLFGQMLARNEAFPMGLGLIGVGERFIGLFHYFDEALPQIVMSKFSGQEYRYPTLIEASVMRRGGYLRHFPQFIMFATRLHNDYDTYQAV